MNVKIVLCISMTNVTGILMGLYGICRLYDNYFTILILPINEHGRSSIRMRCDHGLLMSPYSAVLESNCDFTSK